ncbi:hypothetical protein ACET3X_007881 [Alternaria dauci]|uniref:Uncharacterized protein n=1 Tax=Alternaria dauci TaxID=48095 RepID=A0ABR3UD83_9PLEO
MAGPKREGFVVKLQLSPDKLRQEQLRVDAVENSKLSKADADDTDDAAGATEQGAADNAPAVNAQEPMRTRSGMRVFGATNMDSNPMGVMGAPMGGGMGHGGPMVDTATDAAETRFQFLWATRHMRPARMKSTPPAALAKRRREDAKLEAARQKRIKEEHEAREAKEEEIRRQQEEFIRLDKTARVWAEDIDDWAEFQYKADIARAMRGGADADPEEVETQRKLLRSAMMRGVRPTEGIRSAQMLAEDRRKEEQEMREFLASQAAKGVTYFSD